MNKDKIQLQELCSFLPYGLKVQYEGIINGKELGEQERQYKKEGMPFDFNIEPIKGLKTATLKELLVFKYYYRAYAGNHGRALKLFHNGCVMKPLVRPLGEFNGSAADDEIYDTYGHYISSHADFFSLHEMPFGVIAIMVKHHFDVYNWLDRGLAINLNTIK